MPKEKKWKVAEEIDGQCWDTSVGCVDFHFLDSGSFALWSRSQDWAKETGKAVESYYDQPSFYEYMDSYANFIHANNSWIDAYANVDVIPNPELTWRNQQYLENEHRIEPVPVIHYTTDTSWITRYIEEGYDYIGLGGLVGSTNKAECQAWLDKAFDCICGGGLPRVQVHGFGVTSYHLLTRYPWTTVDSTSWAKSGGFGNIYVPRKRKGKFVFDVEPFVIAVSLDSSKLGDSGQHYNTLTEAEQDLVLEWLDYIDVPLGEVVGNLITKWGVRTRHTDRQKANILFFEAVADNLPKWPWKYKSHRQETFFD